MADVLAEICAVKRTHVDAMKRARPLAELEAAARSAPPPRGFARALDAAEAAGRYPVITEIKKASPSAGLIRADFDPARLAAAYEA
ncbi:MAG: indole-3-glycerol-phosphate synthase TrpC, partial [Alphaproteobacteria bacterium]